MPTVPQPSIRLPTIGGVPDLPNRIEEISPSELSMCELKLHGSSVKPMTSGSARTEPLRLIPRPPSNQEHDLAHVTQFVASAMAPARSGDGDVIVSDEASNALHRNGRKVAGRP
jgi:hypothetical protein